MNAFSGHVLVILYLELLVDPAEALRPFEQFGPRVYAWVSAKYGERDTREKTARILELAEAAGYVKRDAEGGVSLTGPGLAAVRDELRRAGLLH